MFIIKSNKKGETNWSGKEFSDLPAKIYSSYDDALDALRHYWYGGYNDAGHDNRTVFIIPISENKKAKLFEQNKIRW